MNKKLLGLALVAGVAGVAVATRQVWGPLLRQGVQDALLWALDDLDAGEEKDRQDVLAAFEAGEKRYTGFDLLKGEADG